MSNDRATSLDDIVPIATRTVRCIFAGVVMLAASTALVPAAQAGNPAGIEPARGSVQAPVGHRQPTPADVTGGEQARLEKQSIAKDNELLELPPSPDNVGGADQVQSEENALAKRIEQENDKLDHLLQGICRGC